MDMKELASEKRGLEFRIEQNIREFETKTSIMVTGFKIKRIDSAVDCPPIESVGVKIELP
jgi:hypothetical protein